MTQGQGEREVRCPRCGGLMKKPPGSLLYWHADSNHPRCDITNIVEASLVVQPGDEPPNERTQRNRQKK
jgi:hypothetical protein